MNASEEIKTVTAWLKDLSLALKTELSLDAEGCCTLQIDEEMVVTIEVSKDFPLVNIYSALITLPVDNIEEAFPLMAKALELNLFQSLTRGGAIAALPGEGLLIFCFSMPIEGANSEQFSQILGSFIETTVDLRRMLTADFQVPPGAYKNGMSDSNPKEAHKPFLMIKI